MDSLLTSIRAVFTGVKWDGRDGKYHAALPGGYIQVTEEVRMDGRTSGQVAFYVNNPHKRQIFSFGWRNREQRDEQIVRAYSEIQAIHNAVRAALGVDNG